MNKKLIALSVMFLTTSVFAQQPATEKKGVSAIVDILNSQIEVKKKEEPKEVQGNNPGATSGNTTVEINTPSNTSGANYNSDVRTGLDDYQTKQQNLKNKIEQLKAEREARKKEQALLEERLKREQALLAEQNRLQQEAQAKAKSSSSDPKKAGPSKQDYHNRQLEIMKKQAF